MLCIIYLNVKDCFVGSLGFLESEFKKIGWFIPPYVNMGELESMLGKNIKEGAVLTQIELENILSEIYSKNRLADLFIEKYSETPFVRDYINILGNGIETHFLGLHYSAVATLIPVIEGVSRQLALKRGVHHDHIKETIKRLCESCKDEVVSRKIGDYKQVESMIDSVRFFMVENIYSKSSKYPHDDNTSRNDILHGSFNDSDYGTAINFYKTIAVINSLCFLSAIDAELSWFPPKGSKAGLEKADYYSLCIEFSDSRV
jgi:hypothetical protein